MDSRVDLDYLKQSLIFQTPEGPRNFSVVDLDDFILLRTRVCISYGAQLGASLCMLVVLLLLAQPKNRRTAMFVIHVLTLALNIIRTVLHSQLYSGPFLDIYPYFGQDYRWIAPKAHATSVASTVTECLVLVCVEISLSLQNYVACVNLRNYRRRGVLVFSTLVASVALGFRTALMIKSAKSISSYAPEKSLVRLNKMTTITTAISICFFCTISITNFGFAAHRRRRLGVRQFGPIHVFLIIGCQTLIITGTSLYLGL